MENLCNFPMCQAQLGKLMLDEENMFQLLHSIIW